MSTPHAIDATSSRRTRRLDGVEGVSRHRRDIASDAGQAQPGSEGRVAEEGGASAGRLEAPGVGAGVEISFHAIEPTRSRRQRRVDGVRRPKFDFHAGRRPRPRRPSASARRRSLMKPQRRPRARKLSMLERRRRRSCLGVLPVSFVVAATVRLAQAQIEKKKRNAAAASAARKKAADARKEAARKRAARRRR